MNLKNDVTTLLEEHEKQLEKVDELTERLSQAQQEQVKKRKAMLEEQEARKVACIYGNVPNNVANCNISVASSLTLNANDSPRMPVNSMLGKLHTQLTLNGDEGLMQMNTFASSKGTKSGDNDINVGKSLYPMTQVDSNEGSHSPLAVWWDEANREQVENK